MTSCDELVVTLVGAGMFTAVSVGLLVGLYVAAVITARVLARSED